MRWFRSLLAVGALLPAVSSSVANDERPRFVAMQLDGAWKLEQVTLRGPDVPFEQARALTERFHKLRIYASSWFLKDAHVQALATKTFGGFDVTIENFGHKPLMRAHVWSRGDEMGVVFSKDIMKLPEARDDENTIELRFRMVKHGNVDF